VSWGALRKLPSEGLPCTEAKPVVHGLGRVTPDRTLRQPHWGQDETSLVARAPARFTVSMIGSS
jgi:hypothetical protein